jgi:hypothetical protein
VGIHTPELDHERVRANVAAHVTKERLDWPHLIDDDYRYWRALDNHYWPAVYLADRCGRLRTRFIGEIHGDQASGRAAEASIEALLGETDCAAPAP